MIKLSEVNIRFENAKKETYTTNCAMNNKI